MQDLSGLTVVSVEHAVAAPYASVKLADAGARVIKVERPEEDFAAATISSRPATAPISSGSTAARNRSRSI